MTGYLDAHTFDALQDERAELRAAGVYVTTAQLVRASLDYELAAFPHTTATRHLFGLPASPPFGGDQGRASQDPAMRLGPAQAFPATDTNNRPQGGGDNLAQDQDGSPHARDYARLPGGRSGGHPPLELELTRAATERPPQSTPRTSGVPLPVGAAAPLLLRDAAAPQAAHHDL